MIRLRSFWLWGTVGLLLSAVSFSIAIKLLQKNEKSSVQMSGVKAT